MIARGIAIGLALSIIALSAPSTPSADGIRDLQWHLDYLRIDEAHQTSTGSNVTVAVVDTGVDANHPDLQGRILPGRDYSGYSADGLGNQDTEGHGTAVSGLIAANGQATGIAPNAIILPIRTTFIEESSSSQDSEAVDWAIDNGATVICLAFVVDHDAPAFRAAIARAIGSDVVVVAGIGNVNETVMSPYPASYPGVVAVTGTDRAGAHAPVSLVGPQATLAAPAVDIVSTDPLSIAPSGYARGDGTSFSTAIVAGVAALVRSKYPDMSAAEVVHRMTYTADDKGPPGRDDEFGYGIVDPVKALAADVPPLAPSPEPTVAGPGEGDDRRGLLIAGAIGVAVLLVGGLVLALRRRPN